MDKFCNINLKQNLQSTEFLREISTFYSTTKKSSQPAWNRRANILLGFFPFIINIPENYPYKSAYTKNWEKDFEKIKIKNLQKNMLNWKYTTFKVKIKKKLKRKVTIFAKADFRKLMSLTWEKMHRHVRECQKIIFEHVKPQKSEINTTWFTIIGSN